MAVRKLMMLFVVASIAAAGVCNADEILKKLEAMRSGPQGATGEASYVVFDRWPNQKPKTIFAALSQNGRDQLVAFRVSRTGELHRLVDFGSDVQKVELRDVTGDRQREILVRLSPGNRFTGIDILSWNGHDFRQIGETNDTADFVDLDHDGLPEIVEGGECCGKNECGAVVGHAYVQKLVHGSFRDVTPAGLVDVAILEKQTSGPEEFRSSWFLADGDSKECRLKAINETMSPESVLDIDIVLAELVDDTERTTGKPIRLQVRGGADKTVSVALPSRCTIAHFTLHGPKGAMAVIELKTAGRR